MSKLINLIHTLNGGHKYIISVPKTVNSNQASIVSEYEHRSRWRKDWAPLSYMVYNDLPISNQQNLPSILYLYTVIIHSPALVLTSANSTVGAEDIRYLLRE